MGIVILIVLTVLFIKFLLKVLVEGGDKQY